MRCKKVRRCGSLCRWCSDEIGWHLPDSQSPETVAEITARNQRGHRQDMPLTSLCGDLACADTPGVSQHS